MARQKGTAQLTKPVEVLAPETELDSAAASRYASVGRQILSEEQWHRVAVRLRLSPRELQIVQAVADDLKDTAIAKELNVSLRTVRTHFERLYRKLGVTSRSALLLRVIQPFVQSG